MKIKIADSSPVEPTIHLTLIEGPYGTRIAAGSQDNPQRWTVATFRELDGKMILVLARDINDDLIATDHNGVIKNIED